MLGSGRALLVTTFERAFLITIGRNGSKETTIAIATTSVDRIYAAHVSDTEQFAAILRENRTVEVVDLIDRQTVSTTRLQELRNETDYPFSDFLVEYFSDVRVSPDGSVVALKAPDPAGQLARWLVFSSRDRAWISVIEAGPAFGRSSLSERVFLLMDDISGLVRLFDVWSGSEIQRERYALDAAFDETQQRLVLIGTTLEGLLPGLLVEDDTDAQIEIYSVPPCNREIVHAGTMYGGIPRRSVGERVAGFEVYTHDSPDDTPTRILNTRAGIEIQLHEIEEVDAAVVSANRQSAAAWGFSDGAQVLCLIRFPSTRCEHKKIDGDMIAGQGWFSRDGTAFVVEDDDKLVVLSRDGRDNAEPDRHGWAVVAEIDNSDNYYETIDERDVVVGSRGRFLILQEKRDGVAIDFVMLSGPHLKRRRHLTSGIPDLVALDPTESVIAISFANRIEVIDLDPPLLGALDRLGILPAHITVTARSMAPRALAVSTRGNHVMVASRIAANKRATVDLWQMPRALDVERRPQIIASAEIDALLIEFASEDALITLNDVAIDQLQRDLIRWSPTKLLDFYCQSKSLPIDRTDWSNIVPSVPYILPCGLQHSKPKQQTSSH
ncbi:MAG: hypothetical protein WD672_02995 [Woeseia sp.]